MMFLLGITAKGTAMNKNKTAKKLVEVTREQLESASGGGASGWHRIPPRPRNKTGNRPR
jgi:hypothetical protein